MNYVHTHVSERPDPAGVVECTWATGVELARAALAGSAKQPPATAAEREALRASGGGSDSAGSNYSQLALGLGGRYSLFVVPTDLPSTEIPEGTFLGVQGLASHLPTHYQRWDPGFAATGDKSSHSLVVYKLGGVLTICDPLAPWDTAWHGEPITWAAVIAFHDALTGAKVIAVKLPEADMALGWKVTKHQGGTLTIKGPGHSAIRIRDGVLIPQADGTSRPYDTEMQLAVPYPGGAGGLARQDGYQIGEDICCLLKTDVEAVPNVLAPAGPDTTPFAQADVDAAKADVKAKAIAAVSGI